MNNRHRNMNRERREGRRVRALVLPIDIVLILWSYIQTKILNCQYEPGTRASKSFSCRMRLI